VKGADISMSAIDQEMVSAHFIGSGDVERSRRFYTEVPWRQDSHLRRGK